MLNSTLNSWFIQNIWNEFKEIYETFIKAIIDSFADVDYIFIWV